MDEAIRATAADTADVIRRLEMDEGNHRRLPEGSQCALQSAPVSGGLG